MGIKELGSRIANHSATQAVTGGLRTGGAATFALANKGADQVLGALRTTSFILLIVGGIQYVLRFFSISPSLVFGLSLALFVFAGYAVAERIDKQNHRVVVFLPMLLFVLWYFVFNASYDPGFLLYFGLVAFAIFALVAALSKGKSITPEIAGFIPVLFLFLDIGLIPFLVEKLSLTITPLMEALILYMPWWALLGLFTLPPGDSPRANGLITFARVAGILYIIFVLSAAAIPGVGQADGLIPEAGEFEAAQQRARDALPQGEHPFMSNINCIFGGNYEDLSGCVEKRQELSRYEAECKQEKKKSPSINIQDCIKKKIEQANDPSANVVGAVDTTIKEPTTAKLVIDEKSLPSQSAPFRPVSFSLEVENPRNQDIKGDVRCEFRNKLKKSERYKGKIVFGDDLKDNIELPLDKPSYSFLCQRPPQLNGSYEVAAQVEFKDLVTLSRLPRAFIGDKSPEDVKAVTKEINVVIPTVNSLAPQDFAMVSFELGHALGDKIIEEDPYRQIYLWFNIENNAKGKITHAAYDLTDLSSKGFQFAKQGSGSSLDCVQGVFDIDIEDTSSYNSNDLGVSCLVKSYPSELKTMESDEWVPEEFTASLMYNYRIEDTDRVKLTPVEGEAPWEDALIVEEEEALVS